LARNVRTREKSKQTTTALTYWLVLAALVIAIGRSRVSNKEINTDNMFLARRTPSDDEMKTRKRSPGRSRVAVPPGRLRLRMVRPLLVALLVLATPRAALGARCMRISMTTRCLFGRAMLVQHHHGEESGQCVEQHLMVHLRGRTPVPPRATSAHAHNHNRIALSPALVANLVNSLHKVE
jgi:hypothetical protein